MRKILPDSANADGLSCVVFSGSCQNGDCLDNPHGVRACSSGITLIRHSIPPGFPSWT